MTHMVLKTRITKKHLLKYKNRNSTLSSEAPLMKYLNQAKGVAVRATLVHYVEAIVVEVELLPVTGRL